MSRFLSYFIALLFFSAPIHAQTLNSKSVKGIDASGDDYVYYSLEKGRVATDEESGSGAWDIAFQGTNIRVNGASRFIDIAYDDILEAAEESYTPSTDGFSQLPGGSDSGWFNYDSVSHMISVVANRTILIYNTSGHYAKVEITDYYRTLFSANGPAPQPRHYSFRFTLQKDGSRNFKPLEAKN